MFFGTHHKCDGEEKNRQESKCGSSATELTPPFTGNVLHVPHDNLQVTDISSKRDLFQTKQSETDGNVNV